MVRAHYWRRGVLRSNHAGVTSLLNNGNSVYPTVTARGSKRSHTSRDMGLWSESGSIPLRNWIFLLIPSPIPELELNWNWLYSVQAELELNWNCHHLNWNWSRNCFRNCLHGIEIRYEVPHISVAYYSRRLAQVVYTLLVHIDSTKEIRGQLCNCSHNNDTVGSYQPFHDQIGHGLTITGQ